MKVAERWPLCKSSGLCSERAHAGLPGLQHASVLLDNSVRLIEYENDSIFEKRNFASQIHVLRTLRFGLAPSSAPVPFR